MSTPEPPFTERQEVLNGFRQSYAVFPAQDLEEIFCMSFDAELPVRLFFSLLQFVHFPEVVFVHKSNSAPATVRGHRKAAL